MECTWRIGFIGYECASTPVQYNKILLFYFLQLNNHNKTTSLLIPTQEHLPKFQMNQLKTPQQVRKFVQNMTSGLRYTGHPSYCRTAAAGGAAAGAGHIQDELRKLKTKEDVEKFTKDLLQGYTTDEPRPRPRPTVPDRCTPHIVKSSNPSMVVPGKKVAFQHVNRAREHKTGGMKGIGRMKQWYRYRIVG